MLYKDRQQAGRRLAGAMGHLVDADPVVVALPRGGVEVGYAVACELHVPLDVVVVRKLGAPMQPEFGFGAVARDVCVIDESTVRLLGLSPKEIDRVVQAETAEMQRREKLYRGGRPSLELTGRTVVLVDDGLATGGTARAAIRAIRKGRPATVVLAVPVAPPDTAARLAAEVDELICLATPPDFHAVGRWYVNFAQTSDAEVIELLRRAREHLAAPAG